MVSLVQLAGYFRRRSMDVHSYDEGWMELEILLSWKQYDVLS